MIRHTEEAAGKTLPTITATDSALTCGRIDLRAKAFGAVKVPASVTQISWYGAESPTATPTAVTKNDADEARVSAVTAGRWCPIPDECMGLAFVVPVITGASTGTMYYSIKD